jgi:RHS repeat-associated protein
MGNLLLTKARVADGPNGSPRWVGNGRTWYDSQGRPTRQYEPYFADNDAWHWTPEQSVAAVHVDLTYDAAGRVIRVDMPDGTLSRVEHHPWHQRVWDANDTVLDSDWYINALDASHTPTTDTPGFNLLRLLGSPVTGEEDAAWVHPLRRAALKTRLHAGTASTVYLDVLGRPVISDAWNATPVSTSTDDLNSAEPAPANPPARTEEVYREWVEIDRRGRVTALHDARGITCATYVYDDIGRVIHQTGSDNGDGYVLVDAEGKPARTGRGVADGSGVVPFVSRSVYDVLQRPVRTYLSIDGATETLHAWVRYGEEKTDAADTLHLGRAWLTFDTGGMTSVGAYELHGAVSAGEQRLVADHTTDPDWSAVLAAVDAPGSAYDDAVDLLVESTVWASSGTYDALGRPVTATKPDGSILRHEYDAGGALLAHYVRIRGAVSETTVFEGQRYNARGQRTRQVTPGSVRTWSYDPNNFWLNTLKAIRTSDGEILQDLRYTYDPSGNVMELRDRAQQAVFFDNDVVLPSLRHAYDAAYRLIRSEGREHASLGAGSLDWTGEAPREDLPHANNSTAVRRFIQHFTYDANTNLLQWRHVAPANTALAWTRDFVYDSDTNRVASVGIDGVGSATVTHDDFGQMTALPNIHALNWDASGRLRGSQRVSGATADRVWYVYDGGGQRLRKVSETWDAGTSEWRPLASTTYVGGIDVVRSFVGGVLDEERETLHCSDGSSGSGGGGRMLLVETRTVDDGVAVSSPVPLMRFQFDNHLGSACLETTEDGSVISYEEFHPYGTCAYSSGTATLDANPKRYRYSGKERDTESGLYYYGARYLAPWLGRWVSPDPAGFVDGVNLYAFVKGRPSSGWDAEGRESTFQLLRNRADDMVVTPWNIRRLRREAFQNRQNVASQRVLGARSGADAVVRASVAGSETGQIARDALSSLQGRDAGQAAVMSATDLAMAIPILHATAAGSELGAVVSSQAQSTAHSIALAAQPSLAQLTANVRPDQSIESTIAEVATALTAQDENGRPFLYEIGGAGSTPNNQGEEGSPLAELNPGGVPWCGIFAQYVVRKAEALSGEESGFNRLASASGAWRTHDDRLLPRNEIFAAARAGLDLTGSIAIIQGHVMVVTSVDPDNETIHIAHGNTLVRDASGVAWEGAAVDSFGVDDRRSSRWSRMAGLGLMLTNRQLEQWREIQGVAP